MKGRGYKEGVDSAWSALLLAIFSLAHQVDEMYNKTVEVVSMELGLLLCIYLTRDYFIQKASKSGLQTLLLIASIKAHRGLKIAHLARFSHWIFFPVNEYRPGRLDVFHIRAQNGRNPLILSCSF